MLKFSYPKLFSVQNKKRKRYIYLYKFVAYKTNPVVILIIFYMTSRLQLHGKNDFAETDLKTIMFH